MPLQYPSWRLRSIRWSEKRAIGAIVSNTKWLPRVRLQRSLQPQDQVSVYLLYWTAYASANGTMNFRADPYGWDKVLASKIESRSAATTIAAR